MTKDESGSPAGMEAGSLEKARHETGSRLRSCPNAPMINIRAIVKAICREHGVTAEALILRIRDSLTEEATPDRKAAYQRCLDAFAE
jgi:hypothetical protein